MRFEQQLPAQTQGYLAAPGASSNNRKHFGSNKMASSMIFPSKNDSTPINFGKKNTGIKTESQNDMKKSLVFKNEKPKHFESALAPSNMYSSMMIPSSGSSIGYTGSLFDQYLSKKPGYETNYTGSSNPTSKAEDNVDEIMNRYKSVTFSSFSTPTPTQNTYSKPISTNLPSPTQPPITAQKQKEYSHPYTQLVAASNTSNLKSSLIFDNYTVDDFKKRDNLYGCFDGYDKISNYKSYDTFYDKYGIQPSSYTNTNYGSNGTEYNSGSNYDSKNYDKPSYTSNTNDTGNYNYTSSSSNYNYGSLSNNVSNTYSPSTYEIPSTAFSKKSYADYNTSANNYSTNDYPTSGSSNNYTSPNNYGGMTNAERISSSKEIQTHIKETDFQIGKKLGKGQFGEVFLVKHKLTGFVCALKIIPKTVIKEEKVEDQLVREIKIQSYLRNNNLVALYGFFSDYSNVYLLMELCTDGHLFDVLKKTRRIQQPKVRQIVRDICFGLEYIHSERIIHRDIKPQNVILQNGVAKLCDFGWSVFRGQGLRNTFCGTPLYTSPQLIRGEDYDQKIDIWAIGILTYQLLVGKIPFRIYSEDDLSRILQDKITFPQYVDLTYDAKDFIMKLLDRSPGGTYLNMDNILAHPFLKIQNNPLTLEGSECI